MFRQPGVVDDLVPRPSTGENAVLDQAREVDGRRRERQPVGQVPWRGRRRGACVDPPGPPRGLDSLDERRGLLCPRLCPWPAESPPRRANATQRGEATPSISPRLTEGVSRFVRLMRPLLYHLSYTARASDMVGPTSTSVKQTRRRSPRNPRRAPAALPVRPLCYNPHRSSITQSGRSHGAGRAPADRRRRQSSVPGRRGRGGARGRRGRPTTDEVTDSDLEDDDDFDDDDDEDDGDLDEDDVEDDDDEPADDED